MIPIHRTILSCGLMSLPLAAGTVVVTSVPDETHSLPPLTSLDGIPLAQGTTVRVGAFPSLNDDQLLDLASQGLGQVAAAFAPFGDSCTIGQGVNGATGGFEIAVKDSTPAAAWTGQTVSLLIQTAGGEFLVARFLGKTFEAESETGLEPLLCLHLADVKLIVGEQHGENSLATSTAPSVGSFETWMAGHGSITDPLLKSPDADADSDGRSNFLEYATGGDPASPDDPAACAITPDPEGGFWVRFNRVTGLGTVRYDLQASANMTGSWSTAEGTLQPDPENADTLRLRLVPPLQPALFFRLNVEPKQ
ncbi:MAG: hypothetical protein EOP88_11465 [Verrucomicrobiaceae bacterium]|nr:MAG: hypothetical protein EOP88_11465 [Verrucomicrobiaceae bacterium]